jgi:hypothetical protein
LPLSFRLFVHALGLGLGVIAIPLEPAVRLAVMKRLALPHGRTVGVLVAHQTVVSVRAEHVRAAVRAGEAVIPRGRTGGGHMKVLWVEVFRIGSSRLRPSEPRWYMPVHPYVFLGVAAIG